MLQIFLKFMSVKFYVILSYTIFIFIFYYYRDCF